MIKRFIKWVKRLSYYPCLGYWGGHPLDPPEFDCEYENSGEFGCEDCLVNGGRYNPETGKKDDLRYFLINYKDIFKDFIIGLRGEKCCSTCAFCEGNLKVADDRICVCTKRSNKPTRYNDYCKNWEKEHEQN